MCCVVHCSICVTALSGVFLEKSSMKMLTGSQKLKATDNSAIKMVSMCAFPPPCFLSVYVFVFLFPVIIEMI